MNDGNPPIPRIKGAAPPPRDVAQEARRAEALRVNLRRRKSAVSPSQVTPAGGER